MLRLKEKAIEIFEIFYGEELEATKKKKAARRAIYEKAEKVAKNRKELAPIIADTNIWDMSILTINKGAC